MLFTSAAKKLNRRHSYESQENLLYTRHMDIYWGFFKDISRGTPKWGWRGYLLNSMVLGLNTLPQWLNKYNVLICIWSFMHIPDSLFVPSEFCNKWEDFHGYFNNLLKWSGQHSLSLMVNACTTQFIKSTDKMQADLSLHWSQITGQEFPNFTNSLFLF